MDAVDRLLLGGIYRRGLILESYLAANLRLTDAQ